MIKIIKYHRNLSTFLYNRRFPYAQLRGLVSSPSALLHNQSDEWTKLLDEHPSKFKSRSFEDVLCLSKNFAERTKTYGKDRFLLSRFNAMILSYIEEHGLRKRNLTVNQCLELFELQAPTNLDKNIVIFASRIFSRVKQKYTEKDFPASEDIDLTIRILLKLAKHTIYYPEMMDFISKDLPMLNISQLLDYAHLSRQGGLRAKHHLDRAYKQCIKRINEFNCEEFLRSLHSFESFSAEYKDIFLENIPKIRDNLSIASERDLLMFLNVSKVLFSHKEAVVIRDYVLEKIIANKGSYDVNFLISCMAELQRLEKTYVSNEFIEYVISRNDFVEEFRRCKIDVLVELLIPLFNCRRNNYLFKLFDTLSDRITELTQHTNIGIWWCIYDRMYSNSWFHIPFMRAGAYHIIMEGTLLHQISPHQVVRIIQTYHKAHFFHEESLSKLLKIIDRDFDTLNIPSTVFNIVYTAACANVSMDSLYKKSFDLIATTLGSIDLHKNDPLSMMERGGIWRRDVIVSLWSFAVMELHKKRDMSTLLRIILLPDFVSSDLPLSEVYMVLEVAEAFSIDNVEPELCKRIFELYGDKMRKLEHIYSRNYRDSNTNVHTGKGTYSFTRDEDDHRKARNRAARNIAEMLYSIGRQDVLTKVAPHPNSPYVIDICFTKEEKKGVVLLSGRELMRNHYDGKWTITETGASVLKRKVLAHSGWKVFELSCTEWAKLQTTQARRQYVNTIIEYLDSV